MATLASSNCRILKYGAQNGFIFSKFPNQNLYLKCSTSNAVAAAQQFSELGPERTARFKGGMRPTCGKSVNSSRMVSWKARWCTTNQFFLVTWQVFNLLLYKSCKNVSHIVSILLLPRVSGSVDYGYQLNNYPCNHYTFPEFQPEILETMTTDIIWMIRSGRELKRKKIPFFKLTSL